MTNLPAARWRRKLFRSIMWLATFIAAVYLGGYAFDVHKRTTREPVCQWTEVPNRDAMPYVARYCYLTKAKTPYC